MFPAPVVLLTIKVREMHDIDGLWPRLQTGAVICYTTLKMSKPAAPKLTPPSVGSGARPASPQKSKANKDTSSKQRQTFFVMALNMSWQLAIVVLVPIIGGAELDKHLGTGYALTMVGLLVAIVASSVVVWRSLQVANQQPVPKLTAKQKRDIQKSFKEDDDE